MPDHIGEVTGTQDKMIDELIPENVRRIRAQIEGN